MMPIEDIKHEIEQCKQHIAYLEGQIAEPCMSASIPKNDKALARELTLLGNLEAQLLAVQGNTCKLVVGIDPGGDDKSVFVVKTGMVPPDFSHLLEEPERSVEFVGGPLDGEYCRYFSPSVADGVHRGPFRSVYSLKWSDRVFMYAGVMDG